MAYVTDEEATMLLDGHDPAAVDSGVLGCRPDPAPGLARRGFHFEYEGERGPTLLFRLFSLDRLRAAVAGTAWSVAEVRYATAHRFDAALEKR